jgi:hypothetical protein
MVMADVAAPRPNIDTPLRNERRLTPLRKSISLVGLSVAMVSLLCALCSEFGFRIAVHCQNAASGKLDCN